MVFSNNVADFIRFAAHAKLSRFVSVGPSALQTFPLSFNLGNATRTQSVEV